MSDALTVQPKALLKRGDLIGFSSGLPNGGILDLAGKTDPNANATKALVGAIPIRGESPADYQRNGTSVRIRGFEQHPVASACIREVVNILSAIPFEVYRKVKKAKSGRADVELLPDHPAQLLLETPNPFISAQRLTALSSGHFTAYGNAFWFLERPPTTGLPKPPQAIRIVQPEDVMTVYVNNKGYPVAYLWRDYLGYTHTSPAVDMVHFRDLNLKGMVFGYPRAASALNDIIGDNEASQYTREVVTNHGWAGMIMLMHEESNAQDALTAQASWEEKMVTRGGRGKTAWVGGVKDVKPMGFNLRDLEFPDLRRVTREDICAAFGVDPRMISITSAARDAGLSGKQYSEARRRLITQTIEPLMRAIESELNFWFMPEFGDVWVRFSAEALQAMVEDDAETSTRIQGEVKAQLRTLEEGRSAIGLETEYPDDDHLLVSGLGTNLVAVAVALAGAESMPDAPKNADGTAKMPEQIQAEKPPVIAPSDANGKSPSVGTDGKPIATTTPKEDKNQDGTDPNTGKAPTKPPVAKDKKRMAALYPLITRGVALTPEQRQMLWQEFDTRATKNEPAMKRQAMQLFADERANVAKIFARQAEAAKAAGAERADSGDNPHTTQKYYLDAAKRQVRQAYKKGGEVKTRWQDRMRPLIESTYADGAHNVHARIKKVAKRDDPPINWDLHNPNVQAAIHARADRLSEYVGDTTSEAITDAIALGEAQGMSLNEIGRLIDQTAFGGESASRALMIARTETAGALNQGQFDTAVTSGVIQQKEWLTQEDDRVRDSHAECEDEGRIDIDETFDAVDMLYPGDPDGDAEDVINCRCTLLFYDDRASDDA